MAEFKAFITRGNVVDMAVAVIIGAAFSAIVTSMTNGIIKPLIDWAVGGGEAIGLKTMLKTVYEVDASTGEFVMVDGAKVINWANSIYIDWGNFIMKVIDFLLIALVLFAIIKVFMTIKNVASKAGERAKKQTQKMAKKLKKQGMSEEEALKQAEAQAAEQAAAEPAAPVAPSTEELLIQIRDLLAAQQKGTVEKDSEEKPE